METETILVLAVVLFIVLVFFMPSGCENYSPNGSFSTKYPKYNSSWPIPTAYMLPGNARGPYGGGGYGGREGFNAYLTTSFTNPGVMTANLQSNSTGARTIIPPDTTGGFATTTMNPFKGFAGDEFETGPGPIPLNTKMQMTMSGDSSSNPAMRDVWKTIL